jgi:hypothetical protein
MLGSNLEQRPIMSRWPLFPSSDDYDRLVGRLPEGKGNSDGYCSDSSEECRLEVARENLFGMFLEEELTGWHKEDLGKDIDFAAYHKQKAALNRQDGPVEFLAQAEAEATLKISVGPEGCVPEGCAGRQGEISTDLLDSMEIEKDAEDEDRFVVWSTALRTVSDSVKKETSSTNPDFQLWLSQRVAASLSRGGA